eukprot:31738-Chlamydomonas_euryale.AAC.1
MQAEVQPHTGRGTATRRPRYGHTQGEVQPHAGRGTATRRAGHRHTQGRVQENDVCARLKLTPLLARPCLHARQMLQKLIGIQEVVGEMMRVVRANAP